MEKKGYLLLANGRLFEGVLRGAEKSVTGEAVFTTSVVGYLGTLTDPSYAGQIVVQTFPAIGNYGVIPEDLGKEKAHLAGYVAREICDDPSNFRCEGQLNDYLVQQGIPCLTDVDTRALTRCIRNHGAMNAMILTEKPEGEALEELIAKLQGAPVFSGKILGGCIDSIHDMFDGERYADMPVLCERYGLFPPAEDWRGRILLLESSEEKMPPEKYERALRFIKEAGVFDAVSGVLVGKPMDEAFDAEYRRCLREVIGNPALPVVCNVNVGHALPRCIVPFGVDAVVDADRQRITFAP